VLIESGDAQPRTLANAFLKPVRGGGDLLANAYGALREHLEEFDGMYGRTTERGHAAMHAKTGGETLLPTAQFGERVTLPDLARWAAERV
jgi:CRISPR system Cascade subunit CasC